MKQPLRAAQNPPSTRNLPASVCPAHAANTMTRLSRELQRLYLLPAEADLAAPSPGLVDAEGHVRALVLGVQAPADWAAVSRVWQGVQADLGLPAPAIAVAGEAGYQLWFSLATPVPAAQGQAFLQGLRQRYLAMLKPQRLSLLPASDATPAHGVPLLPAPLAGGERWAAFVSPDLAPLFADTPWLDMPPNADGQAMLLSVLASVQALDLAQAMQQLAPVATPLASQVRPPATPPATPPAAASPAPAEAPADARPGWQDLPGIRCDQSGAVVTLVLDRPPVNALDTATLRALIEALRRIEADAGVRVAILTGAGRCFSAGIDLQAQLAALQAGTAGPMDLGVALYNALLHGSKPLIAAINGPALGAGLGIAASCNILLAAQGAEIGLPEIDVGALGGARHAMRLLGHSTVNRMLLTGHRIGAEELARRGVVEACLPPDQLLPQARAIALQIATKDPLAIALARQCLATVETLPLLEGYAFESRLGRQLGASAGAQAAMQVFLGRRGRPG